ncbi:mandelate racemase/muconate lactonizing enzyme family protein [Opitutia bacterium ISCC 51]|nr:mandelate racemase/muconate lactonizing enzyme family protein [Opitutae bacterium ISCC 51]QXD27562.1 mandelate racemase/muconate lactonizing enzyme family protein [Opitutae bacterium ISCC 52]
MKKPFDYSTNRRNFLKKSVLGGAALGGLFHLPMDQVAAAATSGLNRASSPSNLKITDMRYVTVEHMGRKCSIIRLDTNQDIYGYGEVRDGGEVKHALMLKHLLLGKNPCNVEKLFRIVKPFGGHNRLGGGVSAVDMALWDLTGKAYGVPVWQLLGGKYRDRVRLYGDTFSDKDHELIRSKVLARVEQGFTWLKMLRVFRLLEDVPGTQNEYKEGMLTDKGIALIADYLQMVREAVGDDMPISADHFVGRNLDNMTRQAKALEKTNLAWIEEPINWAQTQDLKALRGRIDTPIATGESMFARESFKILCDNQAVDYVHPDLATAGGILETKLIGDYAEDNGIKLVMHYAGTPVSFRANVHSAAATNNHRALEFHPDGEGYSRWANMVQTTSDHSLTDRGFAPVSDAPGLGIELNMDHIMNVLHPDDMSVFASTEKWNSL